MAVATSTRNSGGGDERARQVARGAGEHPGVAAAEFLGQFAVAAVVADHAGDVGNGLVSLVGQPAEVAPGERVTDQILQAGELAVEVKQQPGIARYGAAYQWLGIAYRRGAGIAAVAAIGEGRTRGKITVGAHAAIGLVQLLVDQVAGRAVHGLAGKGAGQGPGGGVGEFHHRVACDQGPVHIVVVGGKELGEAGFQEQALADGDFGGVLGFDRAGGLFHSCIRQRSGRRAGRRWTGQERLVSFGITPLIFICVSG
ncbi:uncharacterized protein FOKN1_2764 [Thiohalobacter thiocyanaticus]|uniref:Uncharacterized protein n=1 Tax=Thiohalobacter thiocyanaticus TaxID=585455 RepID=A0A1Z4VVA6_9GAMM|nr:uncharacterized protein FOKN1_2764 [Thiohalobacter thiocyanaticus]